MLTTLCVLAVLNAAPGEASPLKIANVRNTYGVLGPARPADAPFLPGDSFVLTFTIEGLTVDAGGKVLYSTEVEVTDEKGKSVGKKQLREQEAVNALGGSELPAYVRADIGVNQPPGEFTLKLTVTDLAAKRSQTMTRKLRIMPPGFNLVRLSTSTDPDGQAPAAALAAGESLWINAGVVGFVRDVKTKQPHLQLTLRILDADGKPTLEKPFSGVVDKDVAAQALSVPARFHVSLNRPGKFTVELEAHDTVAGKKAKLSFPIQVQAFK